MWCLQCNVLQTMRSQPCSSSTCWSGRERQGIIRCNGDFNTVAIGIAKPEGITQIRVAIAFLQCEFYTSQVEASGKCSEFSIGVNLEGQVVKTCTLEGGTAIACAGSC